jgi:hypothetical protein
MRCLEWSAAPVLGNIFANDISLDRLTSGDPVVDNFTRIVNDGDDVDDNFRSGEIASAVGEDESEVEGEDKDIDDANANTVEAEEADGDSAPPASKRHAAASSTAIVPEASSNHVNDRSYPSARSCT